MPQIFIMAWFTHATAVAHSRGSDASLFTDSDMKQVQTFAWIRTWIRNHKNVQDPFQKWTAAAPKLCELAPLSPYSIRISVNPARVAHNYYLDLE